MPLTKELKRIIYIYPLRTSFISRDIRLLSENYKIITFSFFRYQKLLLLWMFLKQLFFLLKEVRKSDVIICKFSGYHSYLAMIFAKIFKKPGVIINGGVDCVSFPSIKYGVFSKKTMGWFSRRSYELAQYVISVHKSLIKSNYTYDRSMPLNQGYRNFAVKTKATDIVIHNGYNQNKWKRNVNIFKADNSFLTVMSNFRFKFTYKLKGIDLLLKVSKLFPDCTFTIVGIPGNIYSNDLYKNVKFLPKVPNIELIDIYSAHRFYMQLSISEGFPNALCESRLCECIPIVSNAGGMVDIVGDTGFILKHRDVNLLKNLIFNALESNSMYNGIYARNRIIKYFPVSKRKKELLGFLSSITNTPNKDFPFIPNKKPFPEGFAA